MKNTTWRQATIAIAIMEFFVILALIGFLRQSWQNNEELSKQRQQLIKAQIRID